MAPEREAVVVDSETGEILPAKQEVEQATPAPVAQPPAFQVTPELNELMVLAQTLIKSGYFPDTKTVAQGVAKILAGRALGLSDWASLESFDFIQGRLMPRAKVLASLVRRSKKYDYRVKQLDLNGCIIEFYKDGKLEGVSSYDVKDAQKAGLFTKEVWQKHFRNMSFSRAMSNGCTWYCPDLILCRFTDGDDYADPVEDIIPDC